MGSGRSKVLQKRAESGPEGRELECCIPFGGGTVLTAQAHMAPGTQHCGGGSYHSDGQLPGTGLNLGCRTARTPARSIVTSPSSTCSSM